MLKNFHSGNNYNLTIKIAILNITLIYLIMLFLMIFIRLQSETQKTFKYLLSVRKLQYYCTVTCTIPDMVLDDKNLLKNYKIFLKSKF